MAQVVSILASFAYANAGTQTFVVASEAEMLALDAKVGDVAVRTDIEEAYILSALPPTVLANWVNVTIGGVTSFNARQGVVVPQINDYTTSIVSEGTNQYHTASRALSAVGKVNDPIGYSLSGGTTLRHLYVKSDCLLDQDLSKASTVEHSRISILATIPILTLADDVTPAKNFIATLDTTAKELIMSTQEQSVEDYEFRMNQTLNLDKNINLFGYLQAEEIPTPAAPGTGFRMYSDDATMGKPHARLSSGEIYDLTAGKENLAVGFEITGGDDAKTLTVLEDVTLDQDLQVISTPMFSQLTLLGAMPQLTLIDSDDLNTEMKMEYDASTLSGYITARNTMSNFHAIRVNSESDFGRFSVGRPKAMALPTIYGGNSIVNDSYSATSNYSVTETGGATDVISNLLMSPRYSNVGGGGDRTDSAFEYGLFQSASDAADDRIFFGRPNISTSDLAIHRSGKISINEPLAQDEQLYVNGDARLVKELVLNEIATPAQPTDSIKLYSKADGKFYVLDKNNVERDIFSPVFDNINLVNASDIENTYYSTLSTATSIVTIYKTDRYTETSGGNANNSAFEIGFSQAGVGFEAQDRLFWGRAGFSDNNLSMFRSGNFSFNSSVDTGRLVFFNGTVCLADFLEQKEIATPTAPSTGYLQYASSAEIGKPFIRLKTAEPAIDLINSGGVTSVSANYEIKNSDKLILVDTTGGAVTLNWSQANLKNHSVYVKLVAGANNVNLTPDGASLIEGATTQSFNTLNRTMGFICDGTDSYFTTQYN